MRAAALPLVLAIAACEPTLELSMVADPAVADSTADLSCVRSVSVYAYGAPTFDGNFDFTSACAGIAAPGVQTIADLPLSAAVSLGIPDNLAAVYAAGIDGLAGECTGWPVFAAMARYRGGDELELRARPLLDCGDRDPTPRPVRVIDFFGLLTTGTCTPPFDATALRGYLGVLADFGAGTGIAYAGSELIFTSAGVATSPSLYRQGQGASCIAANVYDDTARDQTGCVYPDQPNPCGGPAGEVLAPLASAAQLDDSIDPNQFQLFDGAVVVVVIDRTGAPIVGATVTGVDPAQGTVVFTQRTGTLLSPRVGGTATDASGTFILYASEPLTVEIVAGARRRTAVLGSLADFRPSPAVIVLD